MKHAVILAHPKPDSFNAALARVCVETLWALGHAPVLRDLYAMDFDPRLKAGELPDARGFAAAPDVVAERALLADVRSFIFVYPLWFNAQPAILKGYVDRVFGMGFGYEPAFGGTQSLLDGRTLFSVTTSGAPEHWVRSTGAYEALQKLFDEHLHGVCGLRVVDHLHFGAISSVLSEAGARDLFETLRSHLRRRFPKP